MFNATIRMFTLKKEYHEIEAEKIMEMLKSNPGKIPSPSRDDVMSMLSTAWNSLDLDVNEALKQNFLLSMVPMIIKFVKVSIHLSTVKWTNFVKNF